MIAESIGHSDQLGLLIAGYALGSVAGVGLHVLAARTLGRFSTVVFGVALGVLGFALLPFLLEAGWAPGVGALLGAGLGMTNPLWATATAEYSPHHARSTAHWSPPRRHCLTIEALSTRHWRRHTQIP